jgi:hypothetical protein
MHVGVNFVRLGEWKPQQGWILLLLDKHVHSLVFLLLMSDLSFKMVVDEW